MAHALEIAKSGRATCRTCRQGITKGEVRFGEEAVNTFAEGAPMYLWHHVLCAAKKKPSQLREALATYEGEVPERAEVDRLIAENEPKQKPTAFPYAERAPTNRSRCGECGETIEKGELRVATPRETETGPMMNAAVRYLHPTCAAQVAEGDPAGIPGMLEAIQKNSKGLATGDFAELGEAMR